MKVRTIDILTILVVSLQVAVLPLQAEAPTYAVYVVDPPISDQAILAGRPLPAVCKPAKTLDVPEHPAI